MNKNAENQSEYFRWEFGITGETALMKHLAGKLNTIFDVGANIGEWSNMAREFNPNAEIHCFEIVDRIYRKQLDNIKSNSNTIVNSFGLSDKIGSVDISYNPEYEAISTIFTEFDTGSDNVVTGLTFTGDEYIRSRQVDYIDFLKLDVEGAEKLVLDGLHDTLHNNKIGMIFFEYGFINVISKFLLIDAYKLLQPLGYRIGKLNPEGWHPKEFVLTDEDFGDRTGKHVLAVHESKLHLFT